MYETIGKEQVENPLYILDIQKYMRLDRVQSSIFQGCWMTPQTFVTLVKLRWSEKLPSEKNTQMLCPSAKM